MVQINASLYRSECGCDRLVDCAYFLSPLYLRTQDLARVMRVDDSAVLTAINENVVSTAGSDHH